MNVNLQNQFDKERQGYTAAMAKSSTLTSESQTQVQTKNPVAYHWQEICTLIIVSANDVPTEPMDFNWNMLCFVKDSQHV